MNNFVESELLCLHSTERAENYKSSKSKSRLAAWIGLLG